MNAPEVREHERRLTAATLAALFFVEQIFLDRLSIVPVALALLCAAWATYEWRRRLRLRRRSGVARVARLDQIARDARDNPASSRAVVAFVCAACYILIGQLTAGARGGLIGLCCGLVYLLLALLAERYPPQ
jgi:hypothetical protein